MATSIQKIKSILKPFTAKGITRSSLDDYAIIVFPRGMMNPLTPEIRKKIENKLDKILSDSNVGKNFYIHFGMCTRKCSGCHYDSTTQGNKEEIIKAILDHIDLFPSNRYSIDKSKFHFGGGTPSLMSIKQIKSIYDKLVNKFNIKTITEATLEVHPEINRIYSNPENYINQLKNLGITRISLGMQECDDKILKQWGRGHTKSDALKVYKLLKKYKFKTNIDLIWNLPNQTFKSLEGSLRTTFELDPESICAYFFWLKPGTKDYELYKEGRLKLLNKPIEMKCLIKSIASEYGYKQKKPEWFHKEGDLTKYSEKRPSQKSAAGSTDFALLGIGQSSYSYLFSGFKENYMLWSPVFKNAEDASAKNNYRKMIDSGFQPYDRVLVFKKEETIRLYLMFGLRTKTLTKEKLDYLIEQSTSKEIETLVNGYIRRGLLSWNENRQLTFTDAGDMIPNYIMATFTTNEWLNKMTKIENEKENRYYWFPDARKVLKLKRTIFS